jgi:hypothetical protein
MAVNTFAANVNATKDTVNTQITTVKNTKTDQNNAYQADQARIKAGQLSAAEKAKAHADVATIINKIKKSNNGTLIGFDWDKLQDEGFLTSLVFDGTFNEFTRELLHNAVKNEILSEARPKNIQSSVWQKYLANELEHANSKLGPTSALAKGLKVVPWAGLALDVTLGIGDNVNKGASPGRIVSDAAVDVAFGAGTIAASSLVSSLVASTAMGSVVPGVGTAVGLAAGVLIYIGTEVATINGKSLVDWAKEGVYYVFSPAYTGPNYTPYAIVYPLRE